MNLNQGDLYFIGEQDVLSGAVSPYYKIGLVKESRDGDAEDRLGEHQTGNPRALFVHHAVSAPAVSDLEATVHDTFATSRIMGEWFEFGAGGLDGAIAAAEALAAEQREHLAALEAAVSLKSIASTDLVREPSDIDRHWYSRAVTAKVLDSHVSGLLARSNKVLRSALAGDVDVSRFVSVVTKAPKAKFDKAAFKKAHPDIHSTFLVEKTAFRQRFDLKTPKEVVDAIELDAQVVGAGADFDAAIERAAESADRLESLHLGHLSMLGFQARAKWDHEIAVANLKMQCGDAAGVGELLTWKRGESTTEVFDVASFGEQHPDLLAEFTIEERQEAFRVLPMRRYAPSA